MEEAQASARRRSSPGSTRTASPRACLAARPARLDHPHHRARRRRDVRERHLLERDRLRRDRPRHRRPRQQHARRGGPEPARLSPPRAGPAAAVDDVAVRRPARRRARGRARQRRFEPDPLRDPPDDHPRLVEGWASPRTRGRRPGSTSRPGPSRPSPGSTRPRWPAREPRLRGRPLGRSATSSSAASTRSPAIPETGEVGGGGDPRRGGAVALA